MVLSGMLEYTPKLAILGTVLVSCYLELEYSLSTEACS